VTVAQAAAQLGVPEQELRNRLAFGHFSHPSGVVVVHPASAAAYGLPDALPARAVVVSEGGAILRVNENGTIDEVVPGGHPRPGIAGDPSATRRALP